MASHRSTSVKLSVVPIVAAAFLAGCGSEDEEEQAFCVDQTETVVSNEDCDREYDRGSSAGGGFFWFFAGSALGRGFGPGSRISGVPGERVRASDRAALARRGGFGSRSRTTGVGRGTGVRSGGGGGFFGGRSGGG